MTRDTTVIYCPGCASLSMKANKTRAKGGIPDNGWRYLQKCRHYGKCTSSQRGRKIIRLSQEEVQGES
ncbi:MAG: hypothetical protein HRF42_14710 [Candidatus Brocadia sp.]